MRAPLALVLCLAGPPLAAQELERFDEPPPQRPLFERDYLFGAHGGARTWLARQGLTFELAYTGETFWNLRGGLNTHHAREYRGDVSLFLEFDPARAGLWEGGTFFAHLQEEHGHGISEKHVGDFQLISNIDADDFAQVSEFWYQHRIPEIDAWVKLGKIEGNADFVFTENGAEFIHASPGLIPTVPLVAYPDPDWGVVVGFEPAKSFGFNLGVFQGRIDGGRSIGKTLEHLHGPFLIAEPSWHYQLGDEEGTLRLGAWWLGDDVERLDRNNPAPGEVDGNRGFYFTWDQSLWSDGEEAESFQGLGGFVHGGWAPDDRNEAEYYLGGGLQWTGLLDGRDEDVLGAGVFTVWFSRELDLAHHWETAIEVFYKVQLTGWLFIKPDVQYILNPGGMRGRDAFAAGLRFEVLF